MDSSMHTSRLHNAQLRYEWELRQRQQGQQGGGDASLHVQYVVKEKGGRSTQQEEREQVVVPLESKQQVLGADRGQGV